MKKVLIWTFVILACAVIGVGGYYAYQKSTLPPVDEQEQIVNESYAEYERLINDIKNDTNTYKWTVYINPIGGGLDKGNSSNGVNESDITLAVAKYIKLMNQNNDVRIVLTRDTDTNPNTKQRMDIFEAVNPDMVIELRVDADALTKEMGVRVYYSEDYYDYRLTNAEFADTMCRDIVLRTEGVAKGIVSDTNKDYGVLSLCNKPSVVIMCGNIENAEEREALSSDAYRGNIALGIMDAIEECRKNFGE